MHTADVAAFAGLGFLAIGAMLSVSDLALFDTPYALIMGPISWIFGCALMVAWAAGRVGLAVDHQSETPDQRPPAAREPSVARGPGESSKAAAVGSDRKADA